MRRTLLLVLTSLILITGTCQAATINPIRFEGGIAHVSGTAIENTRLSVTVVKQGETPIGPSNIGLVYEIMTDENGDYSFDFVINDLPDGTNMTGWYTLSVTDTDTETENFYFATEAGISSFIDNLNTARANNNETAFKTEFANVDNKILECLGIDFTGYAAIKDAIITAMYQNCTAEINKNGIYNDYCKAVGYTLLNAGDAEGLVKYNPIFEEKAYNELMDSAQSIFIKSVVLANKPYANYSALEESYKKAYALNEANSANSSKLSEKLEHYESLLSLTTDSDYQYYKSISGSAKAAITEDIVDALYNTKAYTEGELLSVIKASVTANKPKDTPIKDTVGSIGGFSVSTSPVVKPDDSADENIALFNDLGNVLWAEKAISSLCERGIISGTGFGNFEPERSVKREEFIKMLILAIDAYDENASCEFKDADKDAWYYGYIASAYQKGIVTGYGDNMVGIGDSLSREEAATMLARCANGLKVVREYQVFEDEAQIADWAKEHIVTLYKAGIINGADGSFCPRNKITRAEAAQMLYGYLEGGK